MDDVFKHLRRLDQAMIDLNGRFDTQDEKLVFLVEINHNLKGLSEFIKRSGNRISSVMRWIFRLGARLAPLVVVYEFFKEPIQAWFKRYFL